MLVESENIQPAKSLKRSSSGSLKVGFVLAAMVATVLFSMPLSPRFPVTGLDASWKYALNEAVARHLVFGRDVVFTFGPLAGVYTKMFHPATDWIMLLGGGLVGAGLSVGCALLAYPRKPLHVVILPFLVAEIVLYDSVFIFLPFVLLLLVLRVCARADSEFYLIPNRFTFAAIAIVACSVAVIPLVKASYTSSAFFCGGLAFVVLLRRRRSVAVVFACLAIAAASGAWVATGQPIGALPRFFVAQGAIISGFSDAMSVNGPLLDLIIYGAVSTGLLGIFYVRFARRLGSLGLIAVASFGFILFVCFKASFVRHDDWHALIAAGALLLAGYCVSALTQPMLSLIVWALAVFGWAHIDHAHSRLDIAMAYQRVHLAVARTYHGIKVRASTPQQLRTFLDQQNSAIRAQLPLPFTEGSVDMYEYELSTIFAHGLGWAPRPAFQSYFTYGSRLNELNVAHLEGRDAPQHVFLEVQPIDARLPALEDAGSWPLLLNRYRVIGRTGAFLVLDRNPNVSNAPGMEDVSTSSERLGQWFNLPKVGEPLWAEIDVRPTLLGRIFGALFKRPQLHILFRYEDGQTETFRYVPAMGHSGFVVSPVIHNTTDFAALLMKGRERFFSNALPASVEIMGDSGTSLFWKRTFDVHLTTLQLPLQQGAENFVYDEWISDPPMNGKTLGDAQCGNLAINRRPVTMQLIDAKGPLLVQGWAAVSVEKGVGAYEVFVALLGDDGNVRAVVARVVQRPEVDPVGLEALLVRAAWGGVVHPPEPPVGFEALLDTDNLSGIYKLQIYVRRQNQFFSCPATVQVRR